MSDTERCRTAGKPFVSFLTGAVIGSGIALLTATKTGNETREAVKRLYEDLEHKTMDVLEKGKECYADLEAKVMHAVHREDRPMHTS